MSVIFDIIKKDTSQRGCSWLKWPLQIHGTFPQRLASIFSSLASPPRPIAIGVMPGGLSKTLPKIFYQPLQ
jgi:hypothetical protein